MQGTPLYSPEHIETLIRRTLPRAFIIGIKSLEGFKLLSVTLSASRAKELFEEAKDEVLDLYKSHLSWFNEQSHEDKERLIEDKKKWETIMDHIRELTLSKQNIQLTTSHPHCQIILLS